MAWEIGERWVVGAVLLASVLAMLLVAAPIWGGCSPVAGSARALAGGALVVTAATDGFAGVRLVQTPD